MKRIERLVLHHSASARSTTFATIKKWHTQPKPKRGEKKTARHGRGWSDIGYNYVILGNGKLRVGRPLPTTGAHARGVNSTSIGVCVVGDNTKPGQEWHPVQISTLEYLIDACKLLWPGIKVCGHRDVMTPGYTECPGLDAADAFGG